jgi:hypothetical protein
MPHDALCGIIVLALALSGGFRLSAAPVTVDRVAFLPARFFVGEEVEAIALVRFDAASVEAFAAKAGAGLPVVSAQADPELRSLSLSKGPDGWELRWRFVAWTPGKGRIPAMELRGLSIPAVDYQAYSVLGPQDRDLSPPKPQLDPPGTSLYLYGFAAFVLFLVFVVFAVVSWLLPAARALLERRKAAQARKTLARTLAWLGKDLKTARPADFYAVLARALRNYLAIRVLPGAPALTPAELAALREDSFPAPGLRDEVSDLLAESDAVRYAGDKADLPRMREAIARASKIGDLAEEALDARL